MVVENAVLPEKVTAVCDDIACSLEPIGNICSKNGLSKSGFYRIIKNDNYAMAEYRNSINSRLLEAFDRLCGRLQELDEIIENQTGKNRGNRADRSDENKRLWAIVGAIKLSIDGLKFLASRHPWLAEKGVNLNVNAQVEVPVNIHADPTWEIRNDANNLEELLESE